MGGSRRPFLLALGARWRLASVTFVLFLGAFVALSFVLPPKYNSTARVQAVAGGTTAAPETQFEALQAAEILALSFSEIARSQTIAAKVQRALPYRLSIASITGDVSVTQVTQTPLINITATAGEPTRAQQLAQTYASTLARYNPLASRSLSVVQPADQATRGQPTPTLIVGAGLILSIILAAVMVALAEYGRVLREEQTVWRG
jgi:capsular polysaccharide biosynthesis protein